MRIALDVHVITLATIICVLTLGTSVASLSSKARLEIERDFQEKIKASGGSVTSLLEKIKSNNNSEARRHQAEIAQRHISGFCMFG